MKFDVALFFGVFVFSLVTVNLQKREAMDPLNLLYDKPGNISIVGVFDGSVGKRCDLRSIKALEEMASAIWTVEALNRYKFLPENSIGLSIYELCRGDPPEMKYPSESTMQNMTSGTFPATVGSLTTLYVNETGDSARAAKTSLSPVKHIIDDFMLVDLVVELLSNLQWTRVTAVFADSKDVLHSFGEKTAAEGICVCNEFLVNDSSRTLPNEPNVPDESEVIVVISAFDRLPILTEMDQARKENLKLILAPRDFVFLSPKGLPRNTIVLLPSIGDAEILGRFVEESGYHTDFFNHREPTKSPLFIAMAVTILKVLDGYRRLQDEPCKGSGFNSSEPCRGDASDFPSHSTNNGTASIPESFNISPDDVENALQVLNLELYPNSETFLYIASLVNDTDSSEDVAVFQIFNLKTKKFQPILLKINHNLLSDGVAADKSRRMIKREKVIDTGDVKDVRRRAKPATNIALIELLRTLIDESMGNIKKKSENRYDYGEHAEPTGIDKGDSKVTMDSPPITNNSCLNFEKNHYKTSSNNTLKNNMTLTWRHHTWVTVNTSITCGGLLCIISVMVYISYRIYNGDVLEGSSCFNTVLMISTGSAFLSSLVFHVKPSAPDHTLLRLICSCRETAPPLTYAVIFSLMLSRSLMLASGEDRNGFSGHINGYLQSILFIFIVGIQISLTSQKWSYESLFYADANCSEIHFDFRVITSLTYEFIVLALLVCVGPFVMRSRRNYREGFLLGISTFGTAFVWTIWVASYFFLTYEHKDAAIAFGLNLTAATLLVCSFIPRTYLMAVAVERTRACSFLPALNHDIWPQISSIKYGADRGASDLRLERVTRHESEYS